MGYNFFPLTILPIHNEIWAFPERLTPCAAAEHGVAHRRIQSASRIRFGVPQFVPPSILPGPSHPRLWADPVAKGGVTPFALCSNQVATICGKRAGCIRSGAWPQAWRIWLPLTDRIRSPRFFPTDYSVHKATRAIATMDVIIIVGSLRDPGGRKQLPCIAYRPERWAYAPGSDSESQVGRCDYIVRILMPSEAQLSCSHWMLPEDEPSLESFRRALLVGNDNICVKFRGC